VPTPLPLPQPQPQPAPAIIAADCRTAEGIGPCLQDIVARRDYALLRTLRGLDEPTLRVAMDEAADLEDDRLIAEFAGQRAGQLAAVSLVFGPVRADRPQSGPLEGSGRVIRVARDGGGVTLHDTSLPSNALATSAPGVFNGRTFAGSFSLNGSDRSYFPNCSLQMSRQSGSFLYAGTITCPRPVINAQVSFDLRDN
jgi:hypothetical protein